MRVPPRPSPFCLLTPVGAHRTSHRAPLLDVSRAGRYEANAKTAPSKFAANFELWEQTLDARKKVYRTVNRCGASVEDACRYPCEEVRAAAPTPYPLLLFFLPFIFSNFVTIPTGARSQVCDYVDQTLFPGFKSTGSASSSCDESPEDPPLEAPRGGVGYAAASYSTRSGSSSGSYSTRSATRPGGPARTSTTRAVRGARHASLSPSSSSSSSSSAGSSSASRSSAGSASGSGSSSVAGSRATPRSVRRPGRDDHQSHHDTEAWMIAAALPEGFQTPFDQTAALAEGKGTMACYTRCRADCAEHHGNRSIQSPGIFPDRTRRSNHRRVRARPEPTSIARYPSRTSFSTPAPPRSRSPAGPSFCDTSRCAWPRAESNPRRRNTQPRVSPRSTHRWCFVFLPDDGCVRVSSPRD